MQITYLGQSGFLVELENKYLIFDYFEYGEYEGKAYEQQKIDPKMLKNKPIYVFCSHYHFDHYNEEINKKWVENSKNITFVLGEIYTDLPQNFVLESRQTRQINDIKVITAKSNDEGCCFLIFVDGLVFYHGGDHTDWGNMQEKYQKEIDFLSQYTQKIDVAFAPICNFYSRRNAEITNAAIYLTQKLGVKNLVPMHARNLIAYNFFKKENEDNIKSNIVVFDEIGKQISI